MIPIKNSWTPEKKNNAIIKIMMPRLGYFLIKN